MKLLCLDINIITIIKFQKLNFTHPDPVESNMVKFVHDENVEGEWRDNTSNTSKIVYCIRQNHITFSNINRKTPNKFTKQET